MSPTQSLPTLHRWPAQGPAPIGHRDTPRRGRAADPAGGPDLGFDLAPNLESTAGDKAHRLAILLHEYDTLRAEIVARTGVGFQRVAVGAAVLAWLGSSPLTFRLCLWLLSAAAAFGLSVWVNHRDQAKLAARLRQIEAQVDAETGGWYVLQWERLWGSAATGGWGRAKPLPVPPRSSTPSDR